MVGVPADFGGELRSGRQTGDVGEDVVDATRVADHRGTVGPRGDTVEGVGPWARSRHSTKGGEVAAATQSVEPGVRGGQRQGAAIALAESRVPVAASKEDPASSARGEGQLVDIARHRCLHRPVAGGGVDTDDVHRIAGGGAQGEVDQMAAQVGVVMVGEAVAVGFHILACGAGQVGVEGDGSPCGEGPGARTARVGRAAAEEEPIAGQRIPVIGVRRGHELGLRQEAQEGARGQVLKERAKRGQGAGEAPAVGGQRGERRASALGGSRPGARADGGGGSAGPRGARWAGQELLEGALLGNARSRYLWDCVGVLALAPRRVHRRRRRRGSGGQQPGGVRRGSSAGACGVIGGGVGAGGSGIRGGRGGWGPGGHTFHEDCGGRERLGGPVPGGVSAPLARARPCGGAGSGSCGGGGPGGGVGSHRGGRRRGWGRRGQSRIAGKGIVSGCSWGGCSWGCGLGGGPWSRRGVGPGGGPSQGAEVDRHGGVSGANQLGWGLPDRA